MLHTFLLYLVFFLFAFEIIFFLFGGIIITNIACVKRLKRDKEIIAYLKIRNTLVEKYDTFETFSRKKLHSTHIDLKDLSIKPSELNRYINNYNLGQIIRIIDYAEKKRLEKIFKKLLNYGFLILLGCGISLLKILQSTNFNIDSTALQKAASSQIFQILAVTDAVLFAVFLTRFFAEIYLIDSLVEKSFI